MSDRRAVLAYGGAFAALSLVMAAWSHGFLEADGITHYLYAREAFASPWIFADVWGRPTVKLLHALPAAVPGELFGSPIGLLLVRATSLVTALVGAALAWRVAMSMPTFHARPAIAFVAALASPLTFLHSFAVLTELPFGTLMIACLAAYAARRWWLLALLAGLLPATRPEGIGFVLVVLVGLAMHRRWLALPLVFVGPLAWTLAGSWLSGDDGNPLTWIVRAWPYSGDSTYASGPLLKFVGMLPAAIGPGLVPFALIGFASIARHARGWTRDHEVRVALAVAAPPAIVLVVHSLLHWTGKMASSGDVRYLVAVSPFWGLLAARGVEVAWRRLRLPRMMAATITLAAVPALMLQAIYPIVPLAESRDAQVARDVAAWWQSDANAETRRLYPNLRVDHPTFRIAAGTSPFDGGSRTLIAERPPGTAYLWHEVYSVSNAGVEFTVPLDLPPASGWADATPSDLPAGWRLFVSEPYDRP